MLGRPQNYAHCADKMGVLLQGVCLVLVQVGMVLNLRAGNNYQAEEMLNNIFYLLNISCQYKGYKRLHNPKQSLEAGGASDR
jgi:hypothetical protein